MRRILAAFILFSATNVFAENFNSITVQGKLTSANPVNDVTVKILSGGQPVSTLPNIDIIPDATDYAFLLLLAIPDPKVFLTGSDYAVSFSTPGWEATFTLTSYPFALAVRGDAQTGDQNVFGAYGNVGIGSSTPSYPLVISSPSLTSANMFAISIGTSNVISMTGTGNLSAKSYQIDGVPVIAALGGQNSYAVAIGTSGIPYSAKPNNTFVGAGAGQYNANGELGYNNSFFGKNAGNKTTIGRFNTFLGASTGRDNTDGDNNIFIGESAGVSNISGDENIFIGNNAGDGNTAASRNILIGNGVQIPYGYPFDYLNIGNKILGDINGSSITLKEDLYVRTLTVTGANASNGYSLNLSSGLVMESGTLKANGAILNIALESPKINTEKIKLYTGVVISSEAQSALGGGVRISSNVYVVGFASAAKFFGDGSGLSGSISVSSLTVIGNAFSVGGSTLVVVNGKVGISSSAPVAQLGVEGSAVISSTLTVKTIMPDNFVGGVMFFAKNNCPDGFLKANGSAVSRANYAKLFDAIGTTFGAGDGSSTFNLPDMRGEFVRGADDGRGVDSGRTLGTAQADAFQGHKHPSGGYGPRPAAGTANVFWTTDSAYPNINTGSPTVTDGGNGTPRISSETRPRNIALMSCIKY